MSDKQDIVDISRQIGTEQFSAAIPEYCGVISVNPTTRARRHRVERQEERFDMAVLERAVAERVRLNIRDLGQLDTEQGPEVECISEPGPDEILIDIRHPDEEERRPLRHQGNEVLRIPFYRLSGELAKLDRQRRYLLYCDKGVMSRLHAAHLQAEGYGNIAVYRP